MADDSDAVAATTAAEIGTAAAAAPTPATKWSVVVAPWLAHLRAVAEVTLALGSTRCPVVFVHMLGSKCGEQWRERLVECREAMELLGMVGAVDSAGFVELLYRDLDCAIARLASDRGDPVTPRFWLSFNHVKEGEAGVDDAVRFAHFFEAAGEQTQFAASDELKHARAEITRECNADMLRKLHQHAQFPIDVKFQPPANQSDESMRTYLENVRTLVGLLAISAITAPSGDYRTAGEMNARDWFPFKPQFVELELTDVGLPPGTSTIVAEIAVHGVCLGPGIDLGSTAALGQLDVADFGPVVLSMTNRAAFSEGREPVLRFPSCERKLRGGYRYNSHLVEAFGATISGADNSKCEAAISAFQVSHDVDEVYLRGMFAFGSSNDVCRKWQWLAYALFSSESASSISSLVIDEPEIGRAELAAINSVLAAKNPAALLLSRQVRGLGFIGDGGGYAVATADDAPGDAVSIFVEAGTSVRINPADSAQSAPVTVELRSGSTFRVLRDDDSCDDVDILFPGYGHCSVSRTSVSRFVVTPEHELASSLSRGYSGSLRSLELRFSELTYSNKLMPLIRYLGPQLEELTLHGTMAASKECVRMILEACPRLKKLALPITQPGFEVELLSAFERASCNLSHLEVNGISPGDATVALARALQNPNRLISTKLRQVALVPAKHFKEAALLALLEVLRVNDLLEKLELGLSRPMTKS